MSTNNRREHAAAAFLKMGLPKDEPNNKSNNKQTSKHDTEHDTYDFLEKYSNKTLKEDHFTRQTFLFRNDLISRFDQLAKTKKRGFKTEAMNTLLEKFLNDCGF